MNIDAIHAFQAVIETAGLRPSKIITDGKLHRCPVDGKPNDTDGAYVFRAAPHPAGWWKNWRTGEEHPWTAKGERKLSSAEWQALQPRIESDRRAHEAETAKRHSNAAAKARRILASASDCTTHPYLDAKGVCACAGLKVRKDSRLLVPVLSPDDNKPMSLQFIDADGDKRFLTGGRIRGGYYPIQGRDCRLFICEGLATGLSIHAATGRTVICAFNAGNLEAVARHFREKYPERELVLCADNDHATTGNPGVSKATAAAIAVGALLAVPRFKEPLGAKGEKRTDFNDLATAEGLGVVRGQLKGANMPEQTCQEQAPLHASHSLRVVTAAELLMMDIPERGHLLYPVIPEQGLAMLYA